MRILILVEGCDGAGKTTLVDQLRSDFGLMAGVRGTRNRDELYKVTREDTYRALSEAVKGNEPPRVWDRLGPISDPIYSRIMGRPCAFRASELDFCLTILKTLKCPIIICKLPLEQLKDNADLDHQMDKVMENLPYLAGAYESVAHAIEGTTTYDYRVEGAYERLCTDVIKPYLLRRKDREWHS